MVSGATGREFAAMHVSVAPQRALQGTESLHSSSYINAFPPTILYIPSIGNKVAGFERMLAVLCCVG